MYICAFILTLSLLLQMKIIYRRFPMQASNLDTCIYLFSMYERDT